MQPSHHQPDIVGNRDDTDFVGWTYPVPEDDTWSCEGNDESNWGTQFAQNTSFAQPQVDEMTSPPPRWTFWEDPTAPGIGAENLSIHSKESERLWLSTQTEWDCRAASGSGQRQTTHDCHSVGEHTTEALNMTEHQQFPMHYGEPQTVAGEQQPFEALHEIQSPVLTQSVTGCATAHGSCLKLTGGAPEPTSTTWATDGRSPSMSTQYYASTTDLLMQNLSMVVGNPSARCYANAPWRAFCWMCAYLAEFNRDPWGVIKEAVQTSLELSEPVDIQQLPGLHQLWAKHDLNVEGDAAHFVHSLWIQSQTRVMQYRHTEIKEGGYVQEHIQLPLIVDYRVLG